MQEILAQIIVIAAFVYAIISIARTIYPYTKKNTVTCKTGNCNCSVGSKKLTSNRLSTDPTG